MALVFLIGLFQALAQHPIKGIVGLLYFLLIHTNAISLAMVLFQALL
jgi:hypothetical protein